MPDSFKNAFGGAQKGAKDFMSQFGGGDNLGLSDEESKAMEDRFKQGEMSFDDFLKQVQVMQKAGSMQAMAMKAGSMFGGGNSGPSKEQLDEGERKLKRYAKYVSAMDAEERAEPLLLINEVDAIKTGGKPVRVERIAEATGDSVEEVGRFVFEFKTLRGAAVKFAAGESPDSIRQDMMAEQQQVNGPKNRAQRRMAKKKNKKVPAKSGGFGR